MKKLILFMFAALLATSCSNESEKSVLKGSVEPEGRLTIQLAPIYNAVTNGPVTRSIGSGDNDYVEAYISNVVVAVFKSDGTLNIVREATFSEGAVKEFTSKVKVGQNKVYVVANVDPSVFESINNETEFKTSLLSLTQDSKKLPMSGLEQVLIEKDKTTLSTVKLYRVVGKVSIKEIVVNLQKGGYSNATFDIEKVFLQKANSKSTVDYIGSSPIVGTEDNGLMNYRADFYGNYDRHYFYLFEGDSRMVIGGWFKDGNRERVYQYYPIDFTAIYNTHSSYKVEINGTGSDTPDGNIEAQGTLKATLEIVPWDEKDEEKVVFE